MKNILYFKIVRWMVDFSRHGVLDKVILGEENESPGQLLVVYRSGVRIHQWLLLLLPSLLHSIIQNPMEDKGYTAIIGHTHDLRVEIHQADVCPCSFIHRGEPDKENVQPISSTLYFNVTILKSSLFPSTLIIRRENAGRKDSVQRSE